MHLILSLKQNKTLRNRGPNWSHIKAFHLTPFYRALPRLFTLDEAGFMTFRILAIFHAAEILCPATARVFSVTSPMLSPNLHSIHRVWKGYGHFNLFFFAMAMIQRYQFLLLLEANLFLTKISRHRRCRYQSILPCLFHSAHNFVCNLQWNQFIQTPNRRKHTRKIKEIFTYWQSPTKQEAFPPVAFWKTIGQPWTGSRNFSIHCLLG